MPSTARIFTTTIRRAHLSALPSWCVARALKSRELPSRLLAVDKFSQALELLAEDVIDTFRNRFKTVLGIAANGIAHGDLGSARAALHGPCQSAIGAQS